jgi:hypothetical protein
VFVVGGQPLAPSTQTGPHYPSGIIDTVPRACDVFRAYEGMEGRGNENKKIKNRKYNTK